MVVSTIKDYTKGLNYEVLYKEKTIKIVAV